jgi:hypothetical protein
MTSRARADWNCKLLGGWSVRGAKADSCAAYRLFLNLDNYYRGWANEAGDSLLGDITVEESSVEEYALVDVQPQLPVGSHLKSRDCQASYSTAKTLQGSVMETESTLGRHEKEKKVGDNCQDEDDRDGSGNVCSA